MWLPYSKYHIKMRFFILAKSEILDHFWVTLGDTFDNFWTLGLKKVFKTDTWKSDDFLMKNEIPGELSVGGDYVLFGPTNS